MDTDSTAIHALSKAHIAELAARQISAETALQFGVRSHGQDLIFPYLTGKRETLYDKHRSPDKRFWLEPKGSSLRLWNLPALATAYRSGSASTLVICEGEFDAMACVEAGWPIHAVTSVPNGAPSITRRNEITPQDDRAFSYLWDENGGLRSELAQYKQFIIFSDNDAAGINLRNQLMIRLGPEKCYVPVFPEGCKDANEILIASGPEALYATLTGAFPLIPDTLTPIDDIPVQDRMERFESGWSCLDKNLVLRPPELVVVTGRPGAGKSTWALNLGLQLARVHGLGGAVIQFEDDVERTRYELTAYYNSWKKQEDKVSVDPETGELTTEINRCRDPDFLRKYVRVVPPSQDEEDRRDLDWLRTTITEAAQRHGARWVIVDPWNEVEHMFGKNMREDQYINEALRELKRLARRLCIILIIVTHPDKSGGRHESIDEMSLYSISGGAAWKNKADHGIIIEREKIDKGYSDITTVKVDKSKNHALMGEPGIAHLKYDRRSNIFSNVE